MATEICPEARNAPFEQLPASTIAEHLNGRARYDLSELVTALFRSMAIFPKTDEKRVSG